MAQEERTKGTPLTQVIITALNEKKEIELATINDASHFEAFFVAVRTISTNPVANVFKMQSGSKKSSFGVDDKW